MKILIISATPNELKTIKEGIKSANLKEKLNINYLCCGIGNYETISSLEQYLTLNPNPTFIWNIGICRYWNTKNKENHNPIQISGITNIHTKKEMIIPPFLEMAPLKYCFCSENVYLDKSKIQKETTIDDEIFFDSESRGIEFIASKYKFPRLILKIPFNFVEKEKSDIDKNYKTVSNEIDNILRNLPYHNYLTKILSWINNNT